LIFDRGRLPRRNCALGCGQNGEQYIMDKRPTSIAIIAILLGVLSLFGLVGVFMMGSNPQMAKMVEQSHMSLQFLQIWGAIGAVVNIAAAVGIWKGLPWGRVLYVAWSLIGIAVSFFTSPTQVSILISIVIFVIIAAFLFTNRANEWFQARGLALSREPAR
jgi:hypothetical protein